MGLPVSFSMNFSVRLSVSLSVPVSLLLPMLPMVPMLPLEILLEPAHLLLPLFELAVKLLEAAFLEPNSDELVGEQFVAVGPVRGVEGEHAGDDLHEVL
jgi:hypothetical protein